MFTCFSCITVLSIMYFLLISCNTVDADLLIFTSGLCIIDYCDSRKCQNVLIISAAFDCIFLCMKCGSIHLVRRFILQMFVLSSQLYYNNFHFFYYIYDIELGAVDAVITIWMCYVIDAECLLAFLVLRCYLPCCLNSLCYFILVIQSVILLFMVIIIEIITF